MELNEYWIQTDNHKDGTDSAEQKIKKATGRIKVYNECFIKVKELILLIQETPIWSDEAAGQIDTALHIFKRVAKNEQRSVTTKKYEIAEYVKEKESGYEFNEPEREELIDALRRVYVKNQETAHYVGQLKKWNETLYKLIKSTYTQKGSKVKKDENVVRRMSEIKSILKIIASTSACRIESDRTIIKLKEELDPSPIKQE